MGKWQDIKNKLFSSIRITTDDQLQDMIAKAREEGIKQERGWKNDPSTGGTGNISSPRDYLYQDAYEAYKGQVKEEKDSKFDEYQRYILESFAGGRTDLGRSRDYIDASMTAAFQKVAKEKYHSDPHAKSIIENWTIFTIGSGIKFNVEDEKISEVIRDFRQKNKMIKREKNFIRWGYIEGEVFIVYYVDPITGDTLVRRARPNEISNIEHHAEDIETILSYNWSYVQRGSGNTVGTQAYDRWIQDIDYQEIQKNQYRTPLGGDIKSRQELRSNTYIQFIKFGDDTELRGTVPLQQVIRFLKYYNDWLIDRIRLNHERSKVVWIKEVKGRSRESNTASKAPRGGLMLIETDEVKYRIENARLDSNDAKEDGLAILYMIGAGSFLPIHILNQRFDQQNYSSLRKSDSPFTQFIRNNQEFYGEELNRMYRQVILNKIKAGKLQKKTKISIYTQESLVKAFDRINKAYVNGEDFKDVIEEVKSNLDKNKETKSIPTEDVPLGIEFPEILKEDAKAQAEILKIHKELGIASKATLSARAGYNWKLELSNMLKEAENESMPGEGDEPENNPRKDKKGNPGEPPEGKGKKPEKGNKDNPEE